MKITKQNYKYIILDMLMIVGSMFLALVLRFEGRSIPDLYFKIFVTYIAFYVILKVVAYWLFNLYSIYWPTASVSEAMLLTASIAITSLAFLVYISFYRLLPISVIIIAGIIELILMGFVRFMSRYREEHTKGEKSNKKILIVGAGSAGLMLANEIKKHRQVGQLVGFVDDDGKKINTYIGGYKVIGDSSMIPMLIDSKNIDELIVAIPSASRRRKSEIIKSVKDKNVKIKTVPSLYEIINEKVTLSEVREVNIDDLLGRDPIKLDSSYLHKLINDKVVLVTGGGGSIGSELCRQIAKYGPKKLVILDIYENNAYDIQLELKANYPFLDLEVCIENIREKDRMDFVFNKYRPNLVFHAAAHKHVPLMEDSYISAIKNNIFGTRNLLNMADKYKVERFVNISTDKAVNPTNIMGTTKRVIEIMLQSIDKQSDTSFVAVRFGNVLGSNGSVIPLFKKQIAKGGPVTVTDKDIIRYFMTIPEACQLVLQAGAIARGGEIFILDMGEPVKILDLAENLISLSGFVPYKDIDIKFTGLRPGEKLYEELILNLENSDKTVFEKIYIEKPAVHDQAKLQEVLAKLEVLTHGASKKEVIDTLKELVPEFNHKENKNN